AGHLLQDGFHEITYSFGIVAVNPMLVFVQQTHPGLLGQPELVPHAIEYVTTPVVPDILVRKIIAENANIARVEHPAQLDGPAKALQMRLGWMINAHLADRRANRTEAKAMLLEQRLQLENLEVGQIQHIGLLNGAQLNMPNAALLEHSDLLFRIGANLV